jgi:hypothetical protein
MVRKFMCWGSFVLSGAAGLFSLRHAFLDFSRLECLAIAPAARRRVRKK